jgi:Na+/H+ antiporter NhaD/arsenite permease-like protein
MFSSAVQNAISLAAFAAVILIVVFDLLDIAAPALLGLCILLVTGILTESDLIDAVKTGGGSLVLLFGGMVVARVLTPTGSVDLADYYFAAIVKASGKRFLIGMILMIAPICAFLPNATTVILTAPIFIRIARSMPVDIVTPVILCARVGNTSGILTLVGDPATFIVDKMPKFSYPPEVRRR